MAATAFHPHDPPDDLIPRLQRCLPEHWEVCELDGYILVEHDRIPYEQVRANVVGALKRIYGDEWRERVNGFDGP